MCHGPVSLMDSVNPVLPGEGRWLTGDASARASDETGMQLDPMQARLDELLRRLESQESLIRTLQATQVPLNEDTQEAAWWTNEAAEPQQPFDDAWWNVDRTVAWSTSHDSTQTEATNNQTALGIESSLCHNR